MWAMAFGQVKSLQKWSVFEVHLSWWRVFCQSGIIRQKSTKRCVAFCRNDLDKIENLTLYSVSSNSTSHPAVGYPLSEVRMNVSKGPPLALGELAPSLVTYLEAATTHGCQGNETSDEAFEVLGKALENLTDPSNTAGNELSSGFMDSLNALIMEKGKKPVPEAVVNVGIANHILLNLTSGYAILNKHHSSNLIGRRPSTRLWLPQVLGWSGLGLGHAKAFYGEMDMMICPVISGGIKAPNVAVMCGKSNEDDEDDAYTDEGFSSSSIPDSSIAVERKRHVSDSWSLFGRHFSQGFATAVTFSYVYYYSRLGCQRSSLVPTIQISPSGYQIFLYDCKRDVMLANNFLWSRASLTFLWAFVHCHLFFPTTLPQNLADDVDNFGYGRSSCFFANRHNLLFGLTANSSYWRVAEPEEGRMSKY